MEILNAGGWRSPAFMRYLNLEELETDAVVQAHLDESSEDEIESRNLSDDEGANSCHDERSPCAAPSISAVIDIDE